MRITAGLLKGRIVECPMEAQVRPTGSKIRQAFFNILAEIVPGSTFLDLFAGSGLMGLEALSRGAGVLISVEESRKLVKTLESNCKRLAVEAEVICGDISRVLPILEPNSFDVVFADPPYKSRLSITAVETVGNCRLLKPQGIMVVEHARETVLPESTQFLERFDYRLYGQTALSFYRIPTPSE